MAVNPLKNNFHLLAAALPRLLKATPKPAEPQAPMLLTNQAGFIFR
jgi:hypothetical protein